MSYHLFILNSHRAHVFGLATLGCVSRVISGSKVKPAHCGCLQHMNDATNVSEKAGCIGQNFQTFSAVLAKQCRK